MTARGAFRPAIDRTLTIRLLAAAAAASAAVLYYCIGFGVVSVGRTAAGGTPDLLGFGVMAGTAFALVAILLWRFASRPLWAAVALLQVAVLGGYVAAASLRDPPYEPWGLVIKVAQLSVVAAMLFLLIEAPRVRAARSDRAA